jgi:hypothetical protein
MKIKSILVSVSLILLLAGSVAWGDEIILKSGSRYSGKFVRGDSQTVDFQILGRTQTFKTSEVSQILFKEPELEARTTDSRFSTTPPPAPATSAGASSTAAPSSAAAPATTRTPPPQPAAAPDSSLTLPAGTPITIRTTTVIDTDRNRVGDPFDATLEDPVVLNDQTVFPRGTLVHGRIAYAKESGKIAGQSQLVLELTEIDGNGKSYSLQTTDYTEVGSSRGKKTAATVGGTAALGAIIGAIAGGGKGAAVGAASGAAVGTGVQVLTKGETLKIPAETVLEFRLQSPLSIN